MESELCVRALRIQRLEGSCFVRGGRYGVLIDFDRDLFVSSSRISDGVSFEHAIASAAKRLSSSLVLGSYAKVASAGSGWITDNFGSYPELFANRYRQIALGSI